MIFDPLRLALEPRVVKWPDAQLLETWVLPAFASRVLTFDLAATQEYAELVAKAQATGQSIGMADGMIAAIAKANGMTVATRDITPFNAAGVPVIDPWSAI